MEWEAFGSPYQAGLHRTASGNTETRQRIQTKTAHSHRMTMTDEELNQWIQDLLGDETETDSEQDRYRYDRERLLRVIDENNGIRDDCFYTPGTILVYTEEAESLEAVPIWELPLRFPLSGKGARWGYSSLGEIIEQKATLYRQSKAANDIAEMVPDSTPECGTVCLIVPKREGVMSWAVIKAHVAPELNR